MNAVVLQTASRVIMPVMLLLSLVALFRGHNEPGGGFVGGLLAATAFSLYALAFTVDDAKRLLRVNPSSLIGVGLLMGVFSGVVGMFVGEPFLKGMWISPPLPGPDEELKLGTPLIFDIGVYHVVAGVVLMMVFALEDARDGNAADA